MSRKKGGAVETNRQKKEKRVDRTANKLSVIEVPSGATTLKRSLHRIGLSETDTTEDCHAMVPSSFYHSISLTELGPRVLAKSTQQSKQSYDAG
jgi:hypothetical protein